MRGVTKPSSMKDWLRSPPPGKTGGGGKFQSGWRKKPGHIDTWLVGLPIVVWQHGFPIYDIKEDKETKEKTTHVYPRRHTCHETESVLAKQYFREEKGDPTSARDVPPERCGMCKFIEWVWQQCWLWLNTHDWNEEKESWVEKKKGKGAGIDPCAVMFEFVSEASKEENQTIYAGGLCGLFGKKELPTDLLEKDDKGKIVGGAMKAHGISPRDAWKGNVVAKPNYVMCIVDNDDPNAGVQIAQESKELGEKVKEEIIRVDTSNEISIEEHPYCIRWEYNQKENLGKQYKATALLKQKPTDRILKMVRGEQPDLTTLTTPFTQASMRSNLERHCKVKDVPWGEFFPSKKQEEAWAEEDEAAEAAEKAEASERRSSAKSRRDEGESEEDDEDDDSDDDEDDDEEDPDEEVECDGCQKVMKLSDPKCPHCGKKYVEEDEPEEEPEPPKKMRSRAEAKAAKAAAAKSNGNGKEKSTKAKDKDDDSDDADDEPASKDDNQEDEIPF